MVIEAKMLDSKTLKASEKMSDNGSKNTCHHEATGGTCITGEL